MPKQSTFLTIAGESLNRSADTPLYYQLYHSLRRAILSGQLVGGTRLPSSRALAHDLQLSRNTVVNAFEQLTAEGYIEGKIGAGSYIAPVLPDETLTLSAEPPFSASPMPTTSTAPPLSKRGQNIVNTAPRPYRDGIVRPFQPGLPALDMFPVALWEKLLTKRWRQSHQQLLNYDDTAGYRPLREAVVDYLRTARGVRCTSEQVIIVAGAQQGLHLISQLLLDPGDTVWLEDPGYGRARGSFAGAGAQVIPIPLDEAGLDISAGMALPTSAKLVYTTPSFQYPTGITMKLSRRLQWLQWANQHGAWLIEDDYNSEYRYVGRPLAALQGLDTYQRVIYVGTFSKVLFPALRLGYVVLPPHLVEPCIAAQGVMNRSPELLRQAVLTDFMVEGHFARHIRRMRAVYVERQAVLIEAIQKRLGGFLDVRPADAGLHVVAWLPPQVDDARLTGQLAEAGIDAPALSSYAMRPLPRQGLVLGYPIVPTDKIPAAVARMARVIETHVWET